MNHDLIVFIDGMMKEVGVSEDLVIEHRFILSQAMEDMKNHGQGASRKIHNSDGKAWASTEHIDNIGEDGNGHTATTKICQVCNKKVIV
jgi:hypothetical protein